MPNMPIRSSALLALILVLVISATAWTAPPDGFPAALPTMMHVGPGGKPPIPLTPEALAFNPWLDPNDLREGDLVYVPTKEQYEIYRALGDGVWVKEARREFPVDLDGDGTKELVRTYLLRESADAKRESRGWPGTAFLSICVPDARRQWVSVRTFLLGSVGEIREVALHGMGEGMSLLEVRCASFGPASMGTYGFIAIPGDPRRAYPISFKFGFMHNRGVFTCQGSAGYALSFRLTPETKTIEFDAYESLPTPTRSRATYRVQGAPGVFPQFVLVKEETRAAEADAAGPARVDLAPPAIPAVKSLAELRALKPVLREGEWEFRAGLADGGAAAEDWKLLYVLASYTGREAKPKPLEPVDKTLGSARPLGAVSFVATSGGLHMDTVIEVEHSRNMMDCVGQYGEWGEFVEELYCGTVPMVGKDGVRVRIYSREPDFRALAEALLPLEKDPPHFWTPLLEPRERGKKHTPQDVLKMRRELVAAVPAGAPFAPIWAAKRGDEARLTPTGDALPGQTPPTNGYESRCFVLASDPATALLPPAQADAARMPLKLSLVDGRLELAAACAVWARRPEDGLLVRWWVNDKPVEAPPSRDFQVEPDAIAVALAEPDGRPVPIPLVLPATLGPLKPGDRVALQVMFCPSGFTELDRWGSRGRDSGGDNGFYPAFPPLLSNRLEFAVTPAMVPQAVVGP